MGQLNAYKVGNIQLAGQAVCLGKLLYAGKHVQHLAHAPGRQPQHFASKGRGKLVFTQL